MGTRFVFSWVDGVALAPEACADAKIGGETGGNDQVEGEIGEGSWLLR